MAYLSRVWPKCRSRRRLNLYRETTKGSEFLKGLPGSKIPFGIHSLGAKVLGTSPVWHPGFASALAFLDDVSAGLYVISKLKPGAHLGKELSLAFSSRIISPLARELL